MRLFLLFLAGVLAAQDDKVTLPTSAADLARGKALYLGSCTYCHGPTGDGGKGADLARPELRRAKTDADLVRIIEVGIPGTEMNGAWHMVRNEMLQTAAYVRTLGKVEIKPVPGNVARGKSVYAKNGCAGCHTVKSGHTFEGGFGGPDLSEIGSRRNAAFLRESVVDPGAALPEQFVIASVTLANGKTLRARLLNEDVSNITLRDDGGKNQVIARTQIKDWKRLAKESPMPSYRDKIKGAELDDLIAYLASLKEAK